MTKEWSNLVMERPADGVVRLNFNRPEKRNALNRALTGEILDALETVRADPEVRVVITRGNGPCYCAGADLARPAHTPQRTTAGLGPFPPEPHVLREL